MVETTIWTPHLLRVQYKLYIKNIFLFKKKNYKKESLHLISLSINQEEKKIKKNEVGRLLRTFCKKETVKSIIGPSLFIVENVNESYCFINGKFAYRE